MATTTTATSNYRGELYLIGANQTPFLNMAGGLNDGKRSASFSFPMAQTYALNDATQNVQTETASIAAGTPETYTRSEKTNTAQIMKYDAAVSFKKQSQYGLMSGINTNDGNPVNDELLFQKSAGLRQMAKDLEFSFLQGTYVDGAAVGTAAQTRGIIEGTTSNNITAGSVDLSKALIDELLRTMAASGAIFENCVIFVNAFQKQAITNIYGYAPTDRNIGGVDVRQLETDFANISIVYAPQMPAGNVQIAEMSAVNPVFVPVMFNGEEFVTDMSAGSDVLWVPTAVTTAAKGGFYYTQVGLDYGPQEYHGKITGLTTS